MLPSITSEEIEQVGLSSMYGCLSQAVGVGWGEKLENDIDLDPPSMRQAIGWSFALRNIRRMEIEEAGTQLMKSTGAESVRDVKASLLPTAHYPNVYVQNFQPSIHRFSACFVVHNQRLCSCKALFLLGMIQHRHS